MIRDFNVLTRALIGAAAGIVLSMPFYSMARAVNGGRFNYEHSTKTSQVISESDGLGRTVFERSCVLGNKGSKGRGQPDRMLHSVAKYWQDGINGATTYFDGGDKGKLDGKVDEISRDGVLLIRGNDYGAHKSDFDEGDGELARTEGRFSDQIEALVFDCG